MAIKASHRQEDSSAWTELAALIRDLKTVISDCGPRMNLEIARCLSLFKVGERKEKGKGWGSLSRRGIIIHFFFSLPQIKCSAHLNGLSDTAVDILTSAHCDLLRYLKNPFHEVDTDLESLLANDRLRILTAFVLLRRCEWPSSAGCRSSSPCWIGSLRRIVPRLTRTRLSTFFPPPYSTYSSSSRLEYTL